MSIELMGINIDNYSFEESIKKGVEFIHSDKVSQVVTINPEMYNEIQSNTEFKKIIDEADIVIPDGIGIKIAINLKGKNINRIAGIDYAKELLIRCAENGDSVAIIGAKENVINKAVENLKNEIKNLNIAYYHHGYFNNNDKIYNDLINTNAKLILVALGSPKQEYFIYNAKKILNPCLMIGIGGSLDVWSGNLKRAPKFIQRIGLEWLYRTICQPERFKRIFPALPLFLIKVITYKKDNKCLQKLN